MRLPRDLSSDDLIQLLSQFGYGVTRQTGSHIRLTTQKMGEHHITIPNHESLRVGTLSSILLDVANHLKMNRETLLSKLFSQ